MLDASIDTSTKDLAGFAGSNASCAFHLVKCPRTFANTMCLTLKPTSECELSIVYVVIYRCLRAKTAEPLLPSMQRAGGAFLGSAEAAILPPRTEACLRGSEARDGYAEGAAAHVVEPDALEKRDARRVSAVFPADAQLQLCADTPPALRRKLHERPDAVHVERDEGVPRKDPRLHVGGKEFPGVVARQPHRCLGEVVRSEREKLSRLREVPREERRARQLDHRAEGEGYALRRRGEYLARYLVDDGPSPVELGACDGERDHDLGMHFGPLAGHPHRGLEDRADLHR